MSDDMQKPRKLDYSCPQTEGRRDGLDPLAAIAITIGILSMVTVVTPDRGGMRWYLQVTVGIWGGAAGMLAGIAAVIRLLIKRSGSKSNIAAAAVAIACAAIALKGGIWLHTR